MKTITVIKHVLGVLACLICLSSTAYGLQSTITYKIPVVISTHAEPAALVNTQFQFGFAADQIMGTVIKAYVYNKSANGQVPDDQATARVIQLRDGKIEVDVIIKKIDASFFVEHNDGISGTTRSKNDYEIIVITVDNISGIFGTTPPGPGENRQVPYHGAIKDLSSENIANQLNVKFGSVMVEVSKREYNETKTSSDLILFPNPASDGIVQLGLPSLSNTAQITVVNALGAVVIQKSINNDVEQTTLQLSSLNKGIYFVRLQSGQNEWVKKLIIK